MNLQFLLLGSLGPSTVTFIAFVYVVTCGGDVEIVIVKVKLLPVIEGMKRKVIEFGYIQMSVNRVINSQQYFNFTC